jgi:hypothetical protein
MIKVKISRGTPLNGWRMIKRDQNRPSSFIKADFAHLSISDFSHRFFFSFLKALGDE